MLTTSNYESNIHASCTLIYTFSRSHSQYTFEVTLNMSPDQCIYTFGTIGLIWSISNTKFHESYGHRPLFTLRYGLHSDLNLQIIIQYKVTCITRHIDGTSFQAYFRIINTSVTTNQDGHGLHFFSFLRIKFIFLDTSATLLCTLPTESQTHPYYSPYNSVIQFITQFTSQIIQLLFTYNQITHTKVY